MESADIQRFWRGMDFLVGFYTSNQKKFTFTEIPLESERFLGKKYRLKIFRPIKPKYPECGILLVHGMSAWGIDDQRLLDVATSMCKSGYTIFVPELEEVKSLKITEDTIHNIADLGLALHRDRKKWNLEKLGFFSISFTGGLGLISLSELPKDIFKSALVVGGYSNFANTMPFVMKNFHKDNYACFIFFYNFLELVVKNYKDLKTIMYEAALDNGLKRTGEMAVAPQWKKKLSEEDQSFFDSICESEIFRLELAEKIRAISGSLIDTLSPINYMEKVFVPITLIHGIDDDVISESESIELSRFLKEKGKTCLLEITGMLSHGDALPVYQQVPYIFGFARAFGYFFENLTV